MRILKTRRNKGEYESSSLGIILFHEMDGSGGDGGAFIIASL